MLDEAERQYVRNPLPDQPIAAMKARLWIRQGRLGEAERGRANKTSHPTTISTTCASSITSRWRECSSRVTGTIEMKDRSATALRLLDRLRQAAEDGGRTGSLIEILMLQALAHHAQGDIPAASTSLERALTLAEPEGYVQLFVDEGEADAIVDC